MWKKEERERKRKRDSDVPFRSSISRDQESRTSLFLSTSQIADNRVGAVTVSNIRLENLIFLSFLLLGSFMHCLLLSFLLRHTSTIRRWMPQLLCMCSSSTWVKELHYVTVVARSWYYSATKPRYARYVHLIGVRVILSVNGWSAEFPG